MIDDQELRAIQFLAERVRKATSGAGPWDSHGLTANLRKLAGRNLHLTIEHVLRHAADPKAKNPGVLLGSYTPEAPTSAGHPHPPRREEACPICGGHLGACPCQRAPRAYDEDTAPSTQRPRPADPATKAAAIAAARAELVRTAGGLETEQGETEESDHE